MNRASCIVLGLVVILVITMSPPTAAQFGECDADEQALCGDQCCFIFINGINCVDYAQKGDGCDTSYCGCAPGLKCNKNNKCMNGGGGGSGESDEGDSDET